MIIFRDVGKRFGHSVDCWENVGSGYSIRG
jgi:hypothetical protein